MDSLTRVAHAMECDLVYALVPRGSLDEVIRKRAEVIAENVVSRVSESMELEEQGVAHAERQRQVQELTADIVREGLRDLWDVR